MSNDRTIKEGPKKDVLPINNTLSTVVPQIMACNAGDVLLMSDYLSDLGYKEMNWNLGCPYPMVANKDLGSGMLNKPDKIFQILDEVCSKTSMNLGIKMRMGYEDTSDILTILPRLNDYPLSEIIVHARYGKQLYTGVCDHKRFKEIISLTNHKLIYNGDIKTVADFRKVKSLFPEINHFMVGRGAISNPFIFEMIQDDTEDFPEDRMEIFVEFLEYLLESYLDKTNNQGNVLLKMKHYWEYFEEAFEDGKKYFRLVKKASSLNDYRQFLRNLIE